MEPEGKVTFTHEELLEITKKTLNELIASDSLLNDLPRDITLEEVSAQLALHYGQSMTVFIEKVNKEVVPVVIPVGSSVADLKKAVKRHWNLQLKKKGDPTKISWRHVWKTNFLVFEGEKLSSDNRKLSEYGIANKSVLTFIKRQKSKR